MALAALLLSIANLPAEIQAHYVQKDGKFVLDVTPTEGMALENVTGLKNALGAERTRAQDLESKLKVFEGLDPVKAREALGKLDEIKNFDPDKKVSEAIKQREQDILAGAERKTKALEGEKAKLLAQLHQEVIVRSATQAISEAGGNVTLLLPHVIGQMKLRSREDGTLVPQVVDSEGRERIGDGSGNPMTVTQLVGSMRETDIFASAFKSSGQSGTGATGAGGKPATGSGGKIVVKANDGQAIGRNLEAIASGKAEILE